MRLGVLQGAVYVVLALPFVGGIWLTYRLILNEWDFYYYLNVRPPSWWVAVAIAGVLAATYAAIALWIYVRWLVAVPALVFENATALGALRESWRRTRGRFLEFAAPRAVGWIIVLLLAAATTWLIRFGGIQAVAASGDSLRVAVVLLIATLALLTVTDVIWLIIAKTVQVMLTVSCYVEGAKGEPGSSVAVTSIASTRMSM